MLHRIEALTIPHLRGTFSPMTRPWSDLRDRLPTERQVELAIKVRQELRRADQATVVGALGAEPVCASDKPLDTLTTGEVVRLILKR